jgi:hypothetical protein
MAIKIDKRHFATALQELTNRTPDPGTFAICFAECKGNEELTKAAYIKARAEELEQEERLLETLQRQREEERLKEEMILRTLEVKRLQKLKEEEERSERSSYAYFRQFHKRKTGVFPEIYSENKRERLFNEWKAKQ